MGENGCSSWPTARVARGGYTRDRGDPTKERPTLEGVAETWATPAAQRFEAADLDKMFQRQSACKAKGKSGNGFGLTLDNQVQVWSTPSTHDGRRPGPDTHSTQGRNLNREASCWSTPRASDPEKAGPNMRRSKGDVPLPAQAMNWPSPTTRIYKGGGQAVTRADGKSRLDMLDMLDWAAEAWSPSPCSAPDHRTQDGPISSNGRLTLYRRIRATSDLRLRSEMKALLRMGARSRKNGISFYSLRPRHFTPYVQPSFRRRLNPSFVEYLMAWPIGWTALEPVATASCRSWLPMRTALFRLGSQSMPPQPDLFGASA